GLCRRDQVEYQLLRTTVAAELQLGQAKLFVEAQLPLHLQALGQFLALQRLVDALAGIVIVVRHQGVGSANGNDQQSGAEEHRKCQDGDDEPSPELRIPTGFFVIGSAHVLPVQRMLGPMKRLSASSLMEESLADRIWKTMSLVLEGSFSGAMESSTGMVIRSEERRVGKEWGVRW